MKKIVMGALFLGSAVPLVVASAQVSGPIGTTLTQVSAIVAYVIPLLLSIAVLLFFWGLVKYIANASDEAAKESGRTLMIWGMIAIFVMVAFWGILGYVQQSLSLTGTVTVAPAPITGPIAPTP